ncbi:hypothetical protein LRS74_15965 [Streptomyces sp. LX-29]|uniref:hypothetical protein n=1 Tax=Streptomyces sp. LX-29 TaxID=2900152 RepID=UPI00240D85A9|nr:hypothetical protein [Streptomyces sp. LX-29]WFB08380.1 hypothetical protein LRS74_15965 [Streptomyces sp. LX-29]
MARRFRPTRPTEPSRPAGVRPGVGGPAGHARGVARPDGSGRPARLRLVALAGVVTLGAGVPLAVATAGSVGFPESSGPEAAPVGLNHPVEGRLHPEGGGRNPSIRVGPGTTAACGPELASPEGVEAQTCVLTEGRESWARTYYRNATGGPLTVALTLMRADGQTRQVYCPVDADDDPATCETPRETATRGARTPRGATAEKAPEQGSERSGTAPEAADGAAERVGGAEAAETTAMAEVASAEGLLLLRSGSSDDTGTEAGHGREKGRENGSGGGRQGAVDLAGAERSTGNSAREAGR